MRTAAYSINPLSGLVAHLAPTAGTYVCDAESSDIQVRRMQIDAQVRSGDFFITLATKLDELSQLENFTEEDRTYELQRMVSDLLYLQHKYEIKRK